MKIFIVRLFFDNITFTSFLIVQVKELDDKNNIGNDVIGKNLRDRHLLAIVECEDANENTPISEAASKSFYIHSSKICLSVFCIYYFIVNVSSKTVFCNISKIRICVTT